MNCVYMGEEIGGEIYQCKIFSKCTKEHKTHTIATCDGCKKKCTSNELKNYEDQLQIIDRSGREADCLRNLLAGGTAWILGGGPSARQQNLKWLKNRGVFSLAINNMAGFFHPNAFICADPPSKFHHGIWRDPSIMKFVPIPKLNGGRSKYREKIGSEFKDAGYIRDCPNVWGFARRVWLRLDDSFFLDDSASWGNLNAGVEATGEEKTACTMLLAIRILYFLGARKINLVGVDFNMIPGDGYSFKEERTQENSDSNNNQYRIVASWLQRLVPVFDRFGLQIRQTNLTSSLTCFPMIDFEQAYIENMENFPSEPFDLEGWYKK